MALSPYDLYIDAVDGILNQNALMYRYIPYEWTYIKIHFLFQFVTVEAPLTNEQRKMYDTAAHVW